ncbi:hypothetical protein ACFWWM_08530 [Streptomyces sp. NPDC058682]|uniref:hypothetical protein n=1 Tax=unclassified Streptomyces TaxID=2593676 RepID=UPI00224FA510|nr:hypothetical protein [Streptomyces sp. NBC_01214]MCX4806382.1 hypothetical protein [Streptomyces sp. NBC_01214]
MSYGLAVWDGDRPRDDHQAGSTHDELYERYLEAVWASPPVIDEASGPIVYLLMSYGKAEEVSEYAAALAREHGLVCFDPQGERLRP